MKKLVYKLILYFNYVLIVALFISYLSVYINPGKAWVFAFFGLAFPYLLLANLLFAIFWLLMDKWKVCLIVLISILLGINYTGKIIRISFKDNVQEDTTSIKVLTYNVRSFNLYRWNKNDSIKHNIIHFIIQQNPQIVCLQEYYSCENSPISENWIRKSFGSTPYSHIHGKEMPESKRVYGMAIFSAYPIVNSSIIKFDKTRNACIYCDIKINNDTLRIYNNHLQSIKLNLSNYAFMDTLKLTYNNEQIKEIKDISFRLKDAFIIRSHQVRIIKKHIQSSPYPVLVCGDFNDTPISYTYHTMKKGLKDAFVEAGNGLGNTYIGRMPSFRIDYIFHSPSWQSSNFKTHKVKLSDHYPLTCYIKK